MTREYKGESELEYYGKLSPDEDEPERDYDAYDPALEALWHEEETSNV